MKMVVNAVIDGGVKDAYIVPVAITYDKVMETNSYIRELLGAVKQKETLGALAAQLTRLINPQSLGNAATNHSRPTQ